MLSPSELYAIYSTSPCRGGTLDFVGRPEQDTGAGTPYDLPRLANFLKQLKYPCYAKAPHTQVKYVKKASPNTPPTSGILDTGKNKLALPYKILQKIDVEAFQETQLDIQSGTALAIRNACDVTRACKTEVEKSYEKWEHRGAYEYLTYFGQNYIEDCLMMLGPNMIMEPDSLQRGTGCGDLDCLPRFSNKVPGSALGASFGCSKSDTTGSVECTPCRDSRGNLNCDDVIPENPVGRIAIGPTSAPNVVPPTNIIIIFKENHGLREGDIVQIQAEGILPDGIESNRSYFVITTGLTASSFILSRTREGSPLLSSSPPIRPDGQDWQVRITNLSSTQDSLSKCCGAGTCAEKMNFCCGDITGDRRGPWGYTATSSQGYNIISSRGFPIRHGGLLKRKSYDGYVNLMNDSGSKLFSCPGDLLLRYIQQNNQYDYDLDEPIPENADYSFKVVEGKQVKIPKTLTPIERMQTISLIYSINSAQITAWIKDLLYNGYGVVVMTNVGFSNKRDSTGISFPDRIWYHTFPIIAYDDRKKEYDECVFLLSNSWGQWNSGGSPIWGPIPPGSFLVTETHLQCMLNLYRTDQWGCRKKRKPVLGQSDGGVGPSLPDWEWDACVEDNNCTPWGCSNYQRALGLAFALSMTDGFPRQNIDYDQFYRISHKNKKQFRDVAKFIDR